MAVKLPVIIVAAALMAAAAVGVSSYVNASAELRSTASGKLAALEKTRVSALQDYLGSIEQDMRFVAGSPFTLAALRNFQAGWYSLGSNATERLQQLYIDDNPHPTGEKENLTQASDGSVYSQAHGEYHPWFRQFLRERGYYDIFLFDLDGNLVYTVFKELDYATNLNTGEWKDTDLGNAFRAGLQRAESGQLSFFDFEPYAPSHGAAASFISTPLVDESGGKVGVLVFQMPIDGLNHVMQVSAGLGETGEIMIIGQDSLMRNDSRFSEESTILKRSVDTPSVAAALSGESGVMETVDHAGNLVISAYAPLDFNGARWAIIAQEAAEEVYAPVAKMRNEILMWVAAIIAVVAALGFLLARGVSRPISFMTQAMQRIAKGDLDCEVPAVGRGDEIGEMAQAVQVFKENAVENERLQAEQKEAEKRASEERRRERDELADNFESSIGNVVGAVSSSANQMTETAQVMSGAAQSASDKSANVATAAEQASQSVGVVASATEELSASFGEIAGQVSESNRIAREAMDKTNATNEAVVGLSGAAERIGQVIGLISDIASQTNLLALNATIEAARAGEAGKGFAVVANEVKSLASQTGKATEEISQQIASIQSETGGAVEAIESIGKTISEMNEIAGSIAAAVEQQTAATGEIARSVQQASEAANEVSGNISQVSEAANQTGGSAADVQGAAGELSQHADALRAEVEKFLSGIRAA